MCAPSHLRSRARLTLSLIARERWLTSAFAKFSTRARGKQPEVIPPPHTATLLGRCDLEIGPHTFHGTALFEIQFHQPVYGAGPAGSLLLPSATASAFNSAAHLPPPPAVERAVASATASPTRTTSPISSVFLSHISQTAATNPQLAELLHLSATQRATGEQIRTLGLIIQAMAAAPPPPRVQAEFVLEFRERAADRWLVPRHLAVCERRTLSAGADGPFAILITTALFPTSVLQVDATGNYAEAARNPQPVTLRLTNATHAMWEFVQRWISYDKVDENSRVLDKLVRYIVPFQVVFSHANGRYAGKRGRAGLPPTSPPRRPAFKQNAKCRLILLSLLRIYSQCLPVRS